MTFRLDDLNDAVELHEEALAKTEGSGNSTVPLGTALAVLVGYTEHGKHANKMGNIGSRGMMEFELFDIEGEPKLYTREVKDEEGNVSIKGTKITHNIATISMNEKANFRKDMVVLSRACGIEQLTPLAMLTKTFMIDVVHNKVGEGKDAKTYANLNVRDAKAPFDCDRKGKPDLSKPLVVPVNTMELPLRVLVWDAPNLNQWASIEIEGTFKTEVAGKEVEKSKNWIQEKIRNAENFSGSPVESMLMQAGNSGEPLPKVTKAKAATTAKTAKTVSESHTTVSDEKPTPSTSEAPKSNEEPSQEALSTTSTLSEDEIGKLEQTIQMIKMCEDGGFPVPEESITTRDELIAKRDGK